jgi:hypothetical protein
MALSLYRRHRRDCNATLLKNFTPGSREAVSNTDESTI